MAKRLEEVYASALFQAGKESSESNKLKELMNQAKEAIMLLKENDEFTKLLVHPGLDHDEKIALVQNVFDGRVDDLITGLLVSATGKNHGGSLISILDYFVKLVMEDSNIGHAVVISAVELSDKQKKDVTDKIISTTKYETMEMEYVVDASIIGGLIIKLGDKVVDSSLRTQLSELNKSLLKA